jgi:transcriptional regulator with XRE-family HTH domain
VLRRIGIPRRSEPAARPPLTAIEFRRAVGERVKGLRMGKGLTQADVAELANIDRAEVSKFENGRHDPRLETLWRIAGALGVSVASLFDPPK